MKIINYVWITLLFSFFSACEQKNIQPEVTPQAVNQKTNAPAEVKAPASLVKASKAVEPFFELMRQPKPDEWLANFNEDGQTFAQYINSKPVLPMPVRRMIYIQPLGNFDKKQLKIIEFTADYLRAFYNLPVKLLARKPIEKPLTSKNYRVDKFSKNIQIRTRYFLDEILQPNLPPDAAALIAFTNEDLYPDENSKYVFGQANLKNKVGVWSLFRLQKFVSYEIFLKRALKIGVHETGHLFSFKHCTKYECVMSGTNNLGETDKRPIDACPECMAKICWMTGYNPQTRYANLAEFARQSGLKKEAAEFTRKKSAVAAN